MSADKESSSEATLKDESLKYMSSSDELEHIMRCNEEMQELASLEYQSNTAEAKYQPNTAEGKRAKYDEQEVIFYFRDIRKDMVTSWENAFKMYITQKKVQVSHGDIFRTAPAADAIVSPANSFGFMDGGIDMAYSRHFGWQMQHRLQDVINNEYDGEILVGQAAIIPAYENDTPTMPCDGYTYNENQPIKYLISAPTMRVPATVADTANAFLAFRGVILAVKKHNAKAENDEQKIKSVLCPGLGTAVGKMPKSRCAHQMLRAYELFECNLHDKLRKPSQLGIAWEEHSAMSTFEPPSSTKK